MDFDPSDNLGELNIAEVLHAAGIEGSASKGNISCQGNHELQNQNTNLKKQIRELQEAIKLLSDHVHAGGTPSAPTPSTAGSSNSTATLVAAPFNLAKLKRELDMFNLKGLDVPSSLLYEADVNIILSASDYLQMESTWTSHEYQPVDDKIKTEHSDNIKKAPKGSKGINGPKCISNNINDTNQYITGKDSTPVGGNLIVEMRKDIWELLYDIGVRTCLPQTFSEMPLCLCERNCKVWCLSESVYASMISTYQEHIKVQEEEEARKGIEEKEAQAAKRCRVEADVSLAQCIDVGMCGNMRPIRMARLLLASPQQLGAQLGLPISPPPLLAPSSPFSYDAPPLNPAVPTSAS
ncbi:hypothetical protein CONPUDRAFT_152890 [Coniophora puteana RWD-64-598 SS2]|uniref:Uncharacterized protein n=1 Tax=Coniophora puteana (strain RWD-64-598) TaxID=741705 RepID=A0A5M3MSJ1_CONPW|nr:uncharacterized protein CONPUDRAFT_152890 [Coniophora puteana RWD-64-598 SS2]EIW81997.1 hypothetical protein CONPUDRAFT_152890 [Coniophora puteana RWD-64-598 SS2]